MHSMHACMLLTRIMFVLEKENTIFKLTCSLIPIIFQFYMESKRVQPVQRWYKMLIKSAVEIKSIMIENE